MTETVVWCTAAAVYGAGALILLLERQPEAEFKGTWAGRIKMKVWRMQQWIRSRPELTGFVEERFRQTRRRKMDQSIFDSSMMLKNLAIVEKEHAFSADSLYEQLMENGGKLKPVYAQMLSLYRGGKDAEAFAYLRENLGSRAGKNFSLVLEKVEKINPQELVEQMEVFQEMMRQQKMTDEMKLVQRNSLLTTAAASAAVFVMVIDFAAVVVFMHTVAMMESVF